MAALSNPGLTTARNRNPTLNTSNTRRASRLSRIAAPALWLLLASTLAGCMATSGGTTAGEVPPGMNAQGEVVNPREVRSGSGQRVKGEGGWEGEITGKPVPGSRFAQLRIGMTWPQAQAMLGTPSDFGAHATGKSFIPFYMGADKARFEAVYKGQGRLIFASSGAGGNDQLHLIWVIHSAQEDGRR